MSWTAVLIVTHGWSQCREYVTLRFRVGKGWPNLKIVNKSKIHGAEEMAQQLRALVALAEDISLVPNTHMVGNNHYL